MINNYSIKYDYNISYEKMTEHSISLLDSIIDSINKLDINYKYYGDHKYDPNYQYDGYWYVIDMFMKNTFKDYNFDDNDQNIKKILYNYVKYLLSPIFDKNIYNDKFKDSVYRFLENFNSNIENNIYDSINFKKIMNTIFSYDMGIISKIYKIFKLENISDDDIIESSDSDDEEILDNVSDITEESSDSYSEYSDTESETESDTDSDSDIVSDKESSDDDKAIDEIHHYQNTTNLLINKKNFKKLVDEICSDINPLLDFDEEAYKALQSASEDYLVGLFEDAQLQAIHAKRTIIESKDLHMTKRIRRE